MKHFNAFDQTLSGILRIENAESGLVDLVTIVTHLGDGIVLAVITIVAFILLLLKKHYRLAWLFVITVGLAFLMSAGLKNLIERARPDEIHRLIHTSSYAFPSGHALRSTTVYACLALIISRFITGQAVKRMLIAGAATVILLIGLSRLWLGVHWPSDVLAGWIIGGTLFMGFWMFAESPKPD